MVPGGRVELPTPAFSGPRSTDELPRHGDNQRFYGKRAGVERENERANWATRFESQPCRIAIATVAAFEVRRQVLRRFGPLTKGLPSS